MNSAVMEKKTPKRAAAPEPKQTPELKLKRILVPVDFSETSMRALDYALELAKCFGSEIHLLNVLEYPSIFNSSRPQYESWDKRVQDEATVRLSSLISEKVDELIWAKQTVRFGRAYKEICRVARTERVDLVVMGTHGLTGLKHVILGSTAERVVRHAPCSVLTVHPESTTSPVAVTRPERILVPMDFSLPSRLALGAATAMAQLYSARIELLYVVPIYYFPGEIDGAVYRSLEARENETARKKLASSSKRLEAQGVQVGIQIKEGRIAAEICRAAEELHCDIIIIATHGLTGWHRATIGSNTEEVVRHARCPVLVVKRSQRMSA